VIGFFTERYPGCEFRQDPDEADRRFRVNLSSAARHDLDRFVRAQRLEAQTRLTRNDLTFVDCRFENTALLRSESRIETISQLHPIVRFVGAKLGEPGALQYPAVAVRLRRELLPAPLPPATYVFAAQRWAVGGVQDVERLYFTAVRTDSREERLSPEDVERLVTTAAAHGTDWLGAVEHVDLAEAGRLANEVCLAEADEAYAAFVSERRAQNDDRADIQVRSAETHFGARLETLTAVRDRHARLGRHGLVRATEGQIESLRRWIDQEKRKIAERRRLTERKDEICVGLIQVE
jgi:hypothetical protein